MPFTSGVYSGLVNSFNAAVSGAIIDPADWNDLFADIESAFNDISEGSIYATTDVASAATCNIGAASTSVVRITGTTTITSLGTTPNCLRYVYFGGVLTLTHNALSLVLLSGANVATVAGDIAIFHSDASGVWREVSSTWTIKNRVSRAGDTMAGNLAFGGFKATGLGAATASGDAVRYEQWTALASTAFSTRAAIAAASIPAHVVLVWMNGYAALGDCRPAPFRRLGSTPGSPRGWHVQSADGAWWIMAEDRVEARQFGAKGDNSTDDLSAINEACAYRQVFGGGAVDLVPTGAAYRITGQIALSNGVVLRGSPGKNFAGATATTAQWTAEGSWLRPEHTSSAAVLLSGHGAGIEGLNFIHTQPATGGGWTPTTYGYCIEQTVSYAYMRDILIVNASHGIHLNYTSGSGGGTGVHWTNINIGAFNVGFKTTNVNDVVNFQNIHVRPQWYSSDTNIVGYQRANLIGWDCGYFDNGFFDGFEVLEANTAIKFTDGTCLGITHSAYNVQMSNVQLSLNTIAMKVAATTTTAVMQLSNCVTQAGNDFGYTWSDTVFQLGSDNVDIKFGELNIREAGGKIMDLGNGTGGKCQIGILNVDAYSTVAAGQTGFNVGAGAALSIAQVQKFTIGSGGARFGGGGSGDLRMQEHERVAFAKLTDFPSTTLNGASWQTLTTNQYLAPVDGFIQGRVVGQINVSTAIALSSFQVALSGQTAIITGAIASTSTGFKTFDSGWIDFPDASVTTIVGQVQVFGTNLVVINQGEVSVMLR